MMKPILLTITFCTVISVVMAQVADSTKRKLNLQGASNFRDLGGYKTKDGHHVKWGKIYRSADISKLTNADLALLQQRNITYDVDLRGNQEAAAAPDKLNPNTNYILCPAGSDSLGNWMKAMTKSKNAGDSLLRSFYANTTYLGDRYRPFFDKLLIVPNDESLLFHCTAGKDRTGIAAALFLYALGVPYQTIEADYTATNYYRRNENVKSIIGMEQMHIDPATAKDLMAAKKEYLKATFNAIRQKYGSVDNFLETEAGLNYQKIAELKAKYLQ